MTNEKMLKMVYNAVKTLPEEEQAAIRKLSKTNITKAPIENIVFILSQMIYELKEDIEKETAKRAGKVMP